MSVRRLDVSTATQKSQELAVGDVVACSVHDIKNSLGVILGLVDTLSGEVEDPSEPVTRAFANLRYEGRRLNTNLVQLLSLYRMSDGAYQVNASEIFVDDFLTECRAMYQEVLSARNIEFISHAAAGLYGYFDRELVMGVVGTIINNAYRYASSRVLLEVSETDRLLRISVADDGPGYPESMLGAAEQQVAGLSFKTGSSGLGLYFARVIAAAHRNKDRCGYVEVSNDGLDGGGRFSLFLP